MKKRTDFIVGFISFLCIALGIYALSSTLGTTYIQAVSRTLFNPLQQGVFQIATRVDATTEQEETLLDKRLQLVNQTELKRDNEALRDQFATADPSPTRLLPAKIVGARAFVPGESMPHTIIVEVGSNQGIKVDHAVVYKNNLIGKVTKTFDYFSEVSLISKPDMKLTAITQNTQALGIMQGGEGGKILLTNVNVSATLEKKDIVLTKGDMNPDGTGYPPNLVIGEIVAVNKKASELFQSADVKSFVDVTRLPMVFIVIK